MAWSHRIEPGAVVPIDSHVREWIRRDHEAWCARFLVRRSAS